MDEHHVRISPANASCGILELSGITGDAKKVLYAIATPLYHPSRGRPAAFLLWSDIAIGSNGVKLAQEWRAIFGNQHFESNEIENPITSNLIKIWCAIIPHEAFKKWYIEERVVRAKKV